MKASTLRDKYISFFQEKLHDHHASGLLIPYDITGKLDESLLFNGAGMIQFKPYFRGTVTPKNKKLVTSQKCLRTGDIECVGDNSHLTFFEMLGNFSFGDYFKKEAIHFAWEFLTSEKWLNLDKNRLCTTIFKEDAEAESYWTAIWEQAGFNPKNKIFKLGEETNYWPAGAFSNGPPGPCGPNSEIFYWSKDQNPPKGDYSVDDYLKDEDAGSWLEIWNLVFIQYEWQGELKDASKPALGYKKSGMPNLPFQSIDTGMGLERTAAVLSGSNTVYDTDVFTSIFNGISKITDGKYQYRQKEADDYAARIIADHMRSAVFCIADGVLPGNTGRGYILRRLIRRAILKGDKVLGLNKNFLHKLVSSVQDALASHYQELHERDELIVKTLEGEENLFRRTLHTGTQLLNNLLKNLKHGDTLPGDEAFKLYDTYGFPLEITQEICQEQGIGVDLTGYELCLKEAQELSRANLNMDTVYGGLEVNTSEISIEEAAGTTTFIGYKETEGNGTVQRIRNVGNKDGIFTAEICTDTTPFYATSGGQVGDSGTLEVDGKKLEVSTTTKENGLFWHRIITEDDSIEFKSFLGRQVFLKIDRERREKLEKNHTTTHLLHQALRDVLGNHVNQAGSLVEDSYLRFDFTHSAALSKEELAQVESIVNKKIQDNLTVTIHEDVPISEAKKMGAMALFGEKYGDFVRVVEIKGYSTELCGGTHLKGTGSAGMLFITHECSAASGVRRIEAKTGMSAYDWMQQKLSILNNTAKILKTSPDSLLENVEKLTKETKELKKKIESGLVNSGSGAQQKEHRIGDATLTISHMKGIDAGAGRQIADRMVDNKQNAVGIVICEMEEKSMIIGKATPDIVKNGFHVGNYVKGLASLAGGGGGGKPDFATAGIKDNSKIPLILEKCADMMSDVLSVRNG